MTRHRLRRATATWLASRRRNAPLAALAALAAAAGGLGAAESVDAGVVAGPPLSVDAAAGLQPISPFVYGIATFGLSVPLAEAMRVPIERWGGDGVTRYDWQYNTSNAGADWFYIGGAQDGSETPSYSPDLDELKSQQSGGTMLMTIPMIPWIAGPAPSQCSFPTPPYPPQGWYAWPVTLPDGARCGQDDSAPTIDWNWVNTDIAQGHVANSPALQQAWVEHLVSTFGNAAGGGVGVYEMDNEPGGWDNTHRDVYPTMTGWDELVHDTEAYASAVKTADPTAKVDGPGDFAYWDNGGPAGDNSASHGVSPMAVYFLQQIGAYQQSSAWQSAHPGSKVIDYFDEHFYPGGPGGAGCIGLCSDTGAANEQARLDSTCELWETSCSVAGTTENAGILATMKSWISQYDPGIPPAISEYDWGGHESLNGALAEADVLGIFGSQGVGLASMWGVPTLLSNGNPQPVVFAFEMYRNYDGQGDGFGDISVQATSGGAGNSGSSQLAVYAAKRSVDGALTVMVINKTASDLTSPLSIAGFSGATASGATAQVYTYDAANLAAIVRQPDLSLSSGSATFPADSITELVIPPAVGAASPPGAPQLGSVMTSDGAATVAFSPPSSDGGSPITSYTVTATDTGTGSTAVGYGAASPIVVPGLRDGDSYTFTVAATNLVGTTSSVTSAPAGVPTTTTTAAVPPPVVPRVTTTTLPLVTTTTAPPPTTTAPPVGTTVPAGPSTTAVSPPPGGTSSGLVTPGSSPSAAGGSPGSPHPAAALPHPGSGAGARAGTTRGRIPATLALTSVVPPGLATDSGISRLSVVGRGFAAHRRVLVQITGKGVHVVAVKVVRADLLRIEVRSNRWARPGRRDVTIAIAGKHAVCRGCLVVHPAAARSGGAKAKAGSKAKAGRGSKAKAGRGSKAKAGKGSKAKAGKGSKAKAGAKR